MSFLSQRHMSPAGRGVACAPADDASGAAASAGAASPQTSGSPTAPETPSTPGFDKVAVMGNVLWLMTQSGAHKYMMFSDMDWMVVPPVALQQYRLWRGPGPDQQGRQAAPPGSAAAADQPQIPLAFASWAFLTPEADERLRTEGIRAITEDDWNAGEQAWLMDMIAPFGGIEDAMKDLKTTVFPDRTIKTVRPGIGGKGISVVEF